MELELKHLAPKLEHKLKGNAHSPDGWHPDIKRGELTGIKYNDGKCWLVVDDHEVIIHDFVPIVRPISDLIKEIDCPEVVGEKIVPMRELFGLINEIHMTEVTYDELDNSSNNVKYGCDDNWNYWIKFEKEDIVLSYDIYEQTFALMRDFDYLSFNYIDMHEKLNEWHFDIDDLIGEGLGQDINKI